MKDVVVEVIYEAPCSVVWQALTDHEQMRKWYFDLPDFKPEVGFKFEFTGQGVKGESYLHLCKVTEVDIHKRLQYSWEYKDQKGFSLVTFDLFEEGDKTRLRLTHSGLDTFPQQHEDFDRKNFQAGWTELLTKFLHNHLEESV